MKKASLSVCIIARNESENIAIAIASVKPIADEVLVVDNGSTDDTEEIARELGARVVHHAWCEDFSAARNQAIASARCDWILFLDADESVPYDSLEEIRRAIAGDADAYLVMIESHVPSTIGQTFVNSYPRLFRRLEGVKFEGRIHEQVFPSLSALGARILPSTIVMKHSGYGLSRDRMVEKLRRNCRLLHVELERNPSDGLTLFHLGETYSLLGEFKKAVEYYEKAGEAKNLPKEISAVNFQNLSSALIKCGNYREALANLRKADRINPDLMTTKLVAASALFAMKRYADAEREIVTYLKKIQHKQRPLSYRLDFNPDASSALVLMARCRLATRDLEGAKQMLRRALTGGGKYDAHVLLGKIAFEELRFSEAVVNYENALKIRQDDERLHFELAKSYVACGEVHKAIEVMERALGQGHGSKGFRSCLGILKIKVKDFDGAIEVLKDVLHTDPDDREVRRRLAGVYHFLGKDEEALACLNPAQQ